MDKIFKKITTFHKRIQGFFNPVGNLFLKYLPIKILLVTTFLDDIFPTKPGLSCETAQIGCQTTCINRYAPISHMQLWNFELFFILFSTILFLIFNYLNDAAYRKYKKFDELYLIETNGIPQQKIKFWEKTRKVGRKDQTVVESKYTIVGYIIMLVFRLACQLICLYLDIELSTHISQKAGGIPEVFNIPERLICSTYNGE